MKVVVTGAGEKLGKWVVKDLTRAGYDVRGTDFKSVREKYTRADLKDYGQVCKVIKGTDAIVHLSTLPDMVPAVPQVVFREKLLVDFAVFEAFKDLNISRLIWASSMGVLGSRQIHYFPMDETHPSLPVSAYAMAKYLAEKLVKLYQKNSQQTFTGLRFPRLFEPEDYWQVPTFWNGRERERIKEEMWAYCDVRDASQACLLALEKVGSGEIYNIAADDTLMPDKSQELIRKHFPGVGIRRGLKDWGSVISTEKARSKLGYKPCYSWRNVLDEDGQQKDKTEERVARINLE